MNLKRLDAFKYLWRQWRKSRHTKLPLKKILPIWHGQTGEGFQSNQDSRYWTPPQSNMGGQDRGRSPI